MRDRLRDAAVGEFNASAGVLANKFAVRCEQSAVDAGSVDQFERAGAVVGSEIERSAVELERGGVNTPRGVLGHEAFVDDVYLLIADQYSDACRTAGKLAVCVDNGYLGFDQVLAVCTERAVTHHDQIDFRVLVVTGVLHAVIQNHIVDVNQ